MPDVESAIAPDPTGSRRRRDGTELVRAWAELEALVREIALRGDLAALIACACEAGINYHAPTHADPGQPPHPGVHVAIKAFKKCMQFDELEADADDSETEDDDSSGIEGESVPLSAVGRWVAWSSDGLRILAVEDTIQEAERKAAEAGEPEPILQVPPAPHRL